jgi:hypothetical protein
MPLGNKSYDPLVPILGPLMQARLSQIVAIHNEHRSIKHARWLHEEQQRTQRMQEFNKGLQKTFGVVDAWVLTKNSRDERADKRSTKVDGFYRHSTGVDL